MDKLNLYREIVKRLIKEYAHDDYKRNGVDRELVFDVEHDHYQIINVSWENDHRIYGCILHFDIKQGKIWLQYNGTEIDFAEELVNQGVLKQDIVIGFYSTFMRKFTEYAVS